MAARRWRRAPVRCPLPAAACPHDRCIHPANDDTGGALMQLADSLLAWPVAFCAAADALSAPVEPAVSWGRRQMQGVHKIPAPTGAESCRKAQKGDGYQVGAPGLWRKPEILYSVLCLPDPQAKELSDSHITESCRSCDPGWRLGRDRLYSPPLYGFTAYRVDIYINISRIHFDKGANSSSASLTAPWPPAAAAPPAPPLRFTTAVELPLCSSTIGAVPISFSTVRPMTSALPEPR